MHVFIRVTRKCIRIYRDMMILFHYMYIHINQLLSELCQLGDLCIDQKGTQVSVVLSALPVS